MFDALMARFDDFQKSYDHIVYRLIRLQLSITIV
jgi:hypothetical protein